MYLDCNVEERLLKMDMEGEFEMNGTMMMSPTNISGKLKAKCIQCNFKQKTMFIFIVYWDKGSRKQKAKRFRLIAFHRRIFFLTIISERLT